MKGLAQNGCEKTFCMLNLRNCLGFNFMSCASFGNYFESHYIRTMQKTFLSKLKIEVITKEENENHSRFDIVKCLVH